MDPSKRVCLKNIPPECTKRDIADLIRNRTGGQPHSIDLGLDKDGRSRRYAHFSVEGAKNVISVLTGAAWRGVTLSAFPAKPHYTYRLAEAKRRRERQEEEQKQQREDYLKKKLGRWLAKTGGELSKERPPKSFYASRQRYALLAAEVAKKFREEHRTKKLQSRMQQVGSDLDFSKDRKYAMEKTSGTPGQKAVPLRGRVQSNLHCKRRVGNSDLNSRAGKRQKLERTKKAVDKASEQPESPQSTGPTKEERKLSGLQAKLAALRAKMK